MSGSGCSLISPRKKLRMDNNLPPPESNAPSALSHSESVGGEGIFPPDKDYIARKEAEARDAFSDIMPETATKTDAPAMVINIPEKKPKRGVRTGQSLKDDFENLEITRKPIIHEFLYERDIFMISADSGVGKSTITAQLAMSLSSGTPLFGGLETRIARTFVIQVEGDYEESIERMRFMQASIPVDYDNLAWHENRRLNISNREEIEYALYEIESVMPNPEVVIIDPIYKLSSEDICTGKGALMVVNFSDAIYDRFNCTVVLIHHNTKDTFVMVDGKKEAKADSYYGHSFIKNHVRTSYSLFRDKETDQPRMIRKKGRGGDTLHQIDLMYDPMTMTCTIAFEHKGTDAIARIIDYIKIKKAMRQKTDFNDVMLNCHVSQAQLRRLKHRLEQYITIEAGPRGKQVWCPK